MNEDIEKRMKKIMESIENMPQEEKDRRAAQRITEDEERQRDRVSEVLAAAKIPRRHATAQISDFGDEWGKTLEKIWLRSGSGFLIALIGPWGVGKTQMAVELIKRHANDMRHSRFNSAMQFFMEIKAGYSTDRTEQEIVSEYCGVHFLVIDEVGKRAETEWENRLLYEMLNRRYNAVRDTLLISNQTMADFEGALGPSLVSRMRETGGIVDCNWKSYRG